MRSEFRLGGSFGVVLDVRFGVDEDLKLKAMLDVKLDVDGD